MLTLIIAGNSQPNIMHEKHGKRSGHQYSRNKIHCSPIVVSLSLVLPTRVG